MTVNPQSPELAMRMSHSPWPPSLIAEARALWVRGLSARAIGKALGVTKGSICGLSSRQNWPARPLRHAGNVEAAPRKRPRLAPAPQSERSRSDAPPTPNGPARFPAAGCCFPFGEPRTPGFRFCGEPVRMSHSHSAPQRSYCPACHARAYQRARPAEAPHVG